MTPAREIRVVTPLFISMAMLLLGTDPAVERSAATMRERHLLVHPSVWLNAPEIRFPERRPWVLLFFTTVTERRVTPILDFLESLHQNPDVVVAGLSPEPEDRARAFVARHRIRFPVGAASADHRRFAVREWPVIVILKPGTNSVETFHVDLIGLSPDQAVRRIRTILKLGDAPQTTVLQPPDDNSPARALWQTVVDDPDLWKRKNALAPLRELMAPAAFLALCEHLLAEADARINGSEADRLYWIGEIKFQRDLADPKTHPKPARLSPASVAVARQLRATSRPDDQPVLPPVGSAMIPSRPVDHWRETYRAMLPSDLPEHLVSRHEIAVGLRDHPDKAAARAALMDLLALETDFGIRAILAISLTRVCVPGDEQAAATLEQAASREMDVRFARPSMESGAFYLRTGTE
jgi:hypothetical protein